MSSPTTSIPSPSASLDGSSPQPPSSRVNLAAAAEAAVRRTQHNQAADAKALFAQERDKRQAFRRLIDPGIVRPNSKEVASQALETLSKLADNLLREPDDPKFQSFKPTNDAIKKRLVDPHGALEYAIALGFRAEVRDFQPYYRFNPRMTQDLRIGAEILREALVHDREKTERLTRAKVEEKAAAEAVKRNVHLAYMDDRKTKEQIDERERQRLLARAAAAAAAPPPAPLSAPSSPTRGMTMPGGGHRLNGDDPDAIDEDDEED